jgi:hypothetical protein
LSHCHPIAHCDHSAILPPIALPLPIIAATIHCNLATAIHCNPHCQPSHVTTHCTASALALALALELASTLAALVLATALQHPWDGGVH